MIILLTARLGNIGQFQWSGENFTNTAEAVSLSVGNSGQPILKAKLKDRKQSPRDAEVNLSERIENQNGKWVFLE